MTASGDHTQYTTTLRVSKMAAHLSHLSLLLLTLLSALGGTRAHLYLPYRKSAPTTPTFRVAVYDQAPTVVSPAISDNVTRDEAVKMVAPTLNDFREKAASAAAQGADMIVFAEYGILPRGTSRDTVLPFLESVPSPDDAWNPCLDPDRHAQTDIQRALSCMARNASLYVVANMGDVVHCGKDCPPSGRLQYNTNVVYDREGRQVARYHKQNLFFEFRFDTPSTTDFSYFDTPFGRFGTFVCFDVLFKKPPITLIEEFQIDHVVFPTAWMNVMPYFSAVPFHQSFAMGHGVNFLSANLHQPSNRFSGSGIYAGNTTVSFRNDDESAESALLIGDLPSAPSKIRRQEVRFTDRETDVLKEPEFRSDVFGDEYSFVRVQQTNGSVMVCQDRVCCHLVYEMDTTSGEHFVLGVFRGLHTREGTYFIEVCALMRCGDESGKSCGETVKRSSTHFSSFNLTANFTTKYVYPQVTADRVHPAPGRWHYDGTSIWSRDMDRPLLAAIFFARRYDLDNMSNGGPTLSLPSQHAVWMSVILTLLFVYKEINI